MLTRGRPFVVLPEVPARPARRVARTCLMARRACSSRPRLAPVGPRPCHGCTAGLTARPMVEPRRRVPRGGQGRTGARRRPSRGGPLDSDEGEPMAKSWMCRARLSARTEALMRRRIIAASVAFAALAFAFADAAGAAPSGPAERPKPTVVLVHGAWADASGFNGEISRLRG